jgi:hypothetical protein
MPRTPTAVLRRLPMFIAMVAASLLAISCAACSTEPSPPASTQPTTQARLRGHVEHLASTIGRRSFDDVAATEKTLAYIEQQLAGAGYTTVREPFTVGDFTGVNLVATLAGASKPEEILIVGAHYDSFVNTPGADDNASGVAGTIEIARSLRNETPARTIRFVFFASEEPPHFKQPTMGSLNYAKAARARGDNVIAMLAIESIGYYSDQPNSQKFPAMLRDRYPTTGNYLALVTRTQDKALGEQATAAFRAGSTLPVELAALPEQIAGVTFSDHWSFWVSGYPALMATDTAMFRNPHYHQPTDTPDTLDYARLEAATTGLRAVVQDLANR